jgi:transposase-like protein
MLAQVLVAEADREALLAFFDFPAEHWDHLRTSNPIESVFATVRHHPISRLAPPRLGALEDAVTTEQKDTGACQTARPC